MQQLIHARVWGIGAKGSGVVAGIGMCFALATVIGCSLGGEAEALRTGGPALSPGEFIDSSVEVVETGTPPPLLAVTPANTTGPFAASGGILDVTTIPGNPAEAAMAAVAARVPGAGDALDTGAVAVRGSGTSEGTIGVSLVDVKVGDINGKPVYANAFLDDLADQLRAERVRMRREEWRRFAKTQIDEKLNLQIRDELLRAEAVNNFTPEQKQGFFSFMRGVQQRIESQNQGSRSATDARLEQTEGMSLDQYMKKREQEELIGFQLREKIDRRVSIPWRDIKQEYDRYFDAFNPPPKARYRLLQVMPANQSAYDTARADGIDFAKIAADKSINRYKPEVGGLEEREIKGDRATAALFGNEGLNIAARSMSPGEIAGPIAVGETQSYLYLEAIVEKTRSLYDAQMDIESIMRRRRSGELTDRYIANLRERASISSVSEMSAELLDVATRRYWNAGNK